MENLIVAYALIFIGLLLLAAELFLPTAGILGVLGTAAVITGVTIAFQYSSTQGVVAMIVVVVLVPSVGPLLMAYVPRTPLGRRFFLATPSEDDTIASMPVNLELEQLRGRYGKTLSPLRPSGVADFDGRRVDVMSEGTLVEAGRWVKVMEVKASRVVVREVSGPPDLASFDANDL